ncbi:MAG TPA: PIG-L family deacetylase [Thermoanaerobaculia bacterium]|nr:PIG-L family deacetylase [Thermoanaerobaculia bacterium]
MTRVLFVFAHQDDEVAAAVHILRFVRSGAHVACVFLTNGEGNGCAAATRDDESRRALASIGVDDVHFGTLPDGALVEHLDEAIARLEAIDADEIWTLAYEGGHQDHDAAHIAALTVAEQRNIPCVEFPLYHGFHSLGPLFRVCAPLPGQYTRWPVSMRDAWRTTRLVRFYQSQRRTWLGLLPFVIWRLFFVRRVVTRDASAERTHARPHVGSLFYERRFGFPYERFSAAAAAATARRSARSR